MSGAELEPVRHDPTLERLALGAIVGQHKQAADAMDRLTEEDFFNPDHKRIFTVMVSLKEAGETVDLVTVYDGIGRLGDLHGAGLLQSLGELGQEAHLTPDLSYTVRELRRLSMSR